MRLQKRENYIKNLKAGLHTLAGKSDLLDEGAAGQEPIIKSYARKKVRGREKWDYYIQINPNKATDHQKMIRSYKHFEALLFDTLERIQAVGFRVTRADLAIDSENEGDYELYQKLNKLLLCCIADSESVKNCYHTRDLWSNQSLSVAIKNDQLEAENYNKDKEAGGSEIKNRLELRSKRITGPIRDEFVGKWCKRLDKAVERFTAVQERYNDELIHLWQQDQQKPEKNRDYMSITAFLIQYKDCIFTRSQLQRFFERIGVENPSKKAKNFKDRHQIEFYSQADLRAVVRALKCIIQEYFNT